jgi:8-oxo-dGTP diphosphatase
MPNLKPGKDYIGVGCGALIVDGNDKVLLMRRGPKSKNQIGYWTQPGGTIEYGEKAKDTIKREVKEELDVKIEIIKLLCYTDHIIEDENQHWLTVAFLAKISSGEPKIMEPEKADRLAWFDLDKLPEPLSITTIRTTNILRGIEND